MMLGNIPETSEGHLVNPRCPPSVLAMCWVSVMLFCVSGSTPALDKPSSGTPYRNIPARVRQDREPKSCMAGELWEA